MAAPQLSQFTAQLRQLNIARPNLYYVEVIPPVLLQKTPEETSLVSMWCANAMTPQVSIMTNDDYMEAGTRRKFAYEYDFQNLVLQFYIDQRYQIKNFFDDWKQLIVPYKRNFGWPADYTAPSLKLYILNMADQKTYEYEYLDVYPKTIQSVDLSYSNGTQPSQFSVEFVFTDFNYTMHEGSTVVKTSKAAFEASTQVTDEVFNQEIASLFEFTDNDFLSGFGGDFAGGGATGSF